MRKHQHSGTQGFPLTCIADCHVFPLQTVMFFHPSHKRPRWQPYYFNHTHTDLLESSNSSTFLLQAPLQKYYNPLAVVFLGPVLGLQPWHITREYQACDLSHRGPRKCASLSLAAIKWVSCKIKRIILSSALSKQKILRTLLKLTFNLLDRKRRARTYYCTKQSKGEALYTRYSYSLISTHMMLFGSL